MGFLNLFKTSKRALDAQADKAAKSIEEANIVEFGQQDIAKMKEDVRTIKGNIGTIKGEVAVLNDKIKSIEAAIEKHNNDAVALGQAGNEDLAVQHINKALALEPQAIALREAIKAQESILEEQIKNKNSLQAAVDQAEADLVTTKAMVDAAKANENLAQVSTTSGTSALAAFKERQEAAKKRLIKSQALKEEGSADTSLEAATAEALGKSQAKDRLAQLMAKKTGS